MSILSNATGINIDVTKDAENLVEAVAESGIADILRSHGLPTTVPGLAQFYESELATEAGNVMAVFGPTATAATVKLINDVFARYAPQIPDITL